MAKVIDRRAVDAGLKEIARKKVEVIVTEKAKLVYKQEAATSKIAKERAMQQKKAAQETRVLLDTQLVKCGIFCS